MQILVVTSLYICTVPVYPLPHGELLLKISREGNSFEDRNIAIAYASKRHLLITPRTLQWQIMLHQVSKGYEFQRIIESLIIKKPPVGLTMDQNELNYGFSLTLLAVTCQKMLRAFFCHVT